MLIETTWPLVAVLLATLIGGITDVWKYRVYNVLTFPLMLTGMLYHGWLSGFEGLVFSTYGMLFGLGILFVPFAIGLMGGGDVKLLAGVGAWLGFSGTVTVFVFSSLAAGVLSACLILTRGKFQESLKIMSNIARRFLMMGAFFGKDDLVGDVLATDDRRTRVIPFGAMMPVGVLCAWAWSWCSVISP